MPARATDPLARLRDWYGSSARDLPWREPGASPWAVLVSEVMLQQTPVARVLPVYLDWMQRWPDPAALAAASSGDAVRHWGRLGYPRRALRLHQAAVACLERHDGQVPSTPEELRALPGVGSYTAAAVAAFAYGQRIAVIDTNVRRVVARWSLGVPSAMTMADGRVEELLPEEPAEAVVTSIALMELGALICVSRGPRCGVCPISLDCRWQLDGAPTEAELGISTRRSQGYEGTDRQARGRVLALLRASHNPVPATHLETVSIDAAQRERAIAGLLEDGLVIATLGGYALPT